MEMNQLEFVLNSDRSLDYLLNFISNLDCSGTNVSDGDFGIIVDVSRKELGNNYDSPNARLKIIDAMFKSGFDLNQYDKKNDWTYGHRIMRDGSSYMIDFAFENGFDFNLLTGQNNWHSISLLMHNMVNMSSEDVKEILSIISNKIDSIDFGSMNYPSLFNILSRYYERSNIVNIILDELNSHSNYIDLVSSKAELVMNNYSNILPPAVKDIFVF